MRGDRTPPGTRARLGRPLYEAGDVEHRAATILGARADEVLHGPRAMLGPPWAKDHRTAFAATVVAAPAVSPP